MTHIPSDLLFETDDFIRDGVPEAYAYWVCEKANALLSHRWQEACKNRSVVLQPQPGSQHTEFVREEKIVPELRKYFCRRGVVFLEGISARPIEAAGEGEKE